MIFSGASAVVHLLASLRSANNKGYSKALYFAMIQIDFQFEKKLFREEKVKMLRNVFRIKKAIF